ncbi:MAG: cytochrome P450, partial [Acidimicrobiaceae bacterium]|nr:cytochrome P450 [Acidimicrobiaceae bacterium]
EGGEIPEGASVLVHYGAANRDGAKFDEADRFDLDRPKKGQHIAFGSGIHHCVGSELARVEMRASFRAFTGRFTALELVDPDLRYHPTFVLRGIQSLKVQLRA